MKIRLSILLVMTGLVGVSYAQVSSSDRVVGLEMREAIEWCRIRHMKANKDDLPRVLLVGDSIVGGHNYQVNELLKEHANCSWLMTSRCLGDPVFDQELELVLGQYEYAVIYFNNGLHGASFSDQQYERALALVFEKLANKKSAVVWRETTSINPNREDEVFQKRINRRNEIAAIYAAKYNIQTDSLGTFEAEDYQGQVALQCRGRCSAG